MLFILTEQNIGLDEPISYYSFYVVLSFDGSGFPLSRE